MRLHCLSGRIILPELLEDAAAGPTRKNLEELVTINRLLGGHRILLDSMESLEEPSSEFTFLDIGAASGDMGRVLNRRFPRARVFSLDRRMLHLENTPEPRLLGDAFALPFADASVDYSHCSLFLHHFADADVVRLLAEMRRVARKAVVLQDLERNPVPYYFVPLTRPIFRWSRLLLYDGPISVEAAFHAGELRKLAHDAGLQNAVVSVHRPAFRLSLIARVADLI